MLKYCWKRLRFIWWKMFKDVQRKLKELSHLRWNSLKTWSISLQKFSSLNIFQHIYRMKGIERWKLFQCIQHYFNSFISTLFQQYYFNKYEFQRISTYLFQLISTIFQHLFQRIYRMKTVERRNLFQHYFNIFNPPGSLMQGSQKHSVTENRFQHGSPAKDRKRQLLTECLQTTNPSPH